MIKIITLLFVLSFYFAGCATTANYEADLNSWLGIDAEELVNQWGYPSQQIKAPNGNDVYVYEWSATGTLPTYTTVNVYGGTIFANTYGGGQLTYWCRTFFEINEDGKIIQWKWEGNNCRTR